MVIFLKKMRSITLIIYQPIVNNMARIISKNEVMAIIIYYKHKQPISTHKVAHNSYSENDYDCAFKNDIICSINLNRLILKD